MTQTSTFDLPAHLSDKAAPQHIGTDDARFHAIAAALDADIAAVEQTLERTLTTQAGDAAGRVERDAAVNHFRNRLRGLRGFRMDAVLGRMTNADGSEPVYIGRLAVHDADGRPLLVDWRSPKAEPFFAATRAEPMGLLSRRRYRWSAGRIRNYWDEILRPSESPTSDPDSDASPDEESALLATLTEARSPRMRTVLTTIAADQDAIIRADARGPLVVDGGPGTGKTVVALHRAAYLLYSDPRLRDRRGGILFVGPHHPYLHYVADVLPSLGEDDVRTCTLSDMVTEGHGVSVEAHPEIRALKASRQLVEAIDAAVTLYEEPPTLDVLISTEWGTVQLGAEDWADAFDAVDPATPHNLARGDIWEELAEIIATQLGEQHDEHPEADQVRTSLGYDEDLISLVHRAWPLLEATDVVDDLFEVPAYLRRCAPSLSREQVQLLQREDARAWTDADLPLLDAARHRLGDSGAEARNRRREAAQRETVEEVGLMLDYLIESDSSDMQELSMLRGEDLKSALGDATPVEVADPDVLAGPFAHVVVDEAQELTAAQWAMILRRCPSRSLTIVGDRAQAADGFTGTWQERLAGVGLERIEHARLSINYRTPAEIMARAAPVIREFLPDANVPTSIREADLPVRHGSVEELDGILHDWLERNPEGTACIISHERHPAGDRVQVLPPHLVKGLEFDLVVLVDPERFGDGFRGAVARYVAMTRSTRELVILRG